MVFYLNILCLMKRVGISSCKPSHNLVDTNSKLNTPSGEIDPNPTHYQSL